MSSRPPRYSQRHFNWGEPVDPDGLIPLDYLMGWLKTNMIAYRQADNKHEVLAPLCQKLNRRGIRCTVANILVEFDCLTRTAWRHRKWITQVMYKQDLFEMYFDGQEPELVRCHRERHMQGTDNLKTDDLDVNRAAKSSRSGSLHWLGESSPHGLSPMAILVSWFPTNFRTYEKADKAGRLKLLKDLCEEMKCAGHSNCTENRIAAKIYQIRSEVEQELRGHHDRTGCFRRYRDFFMEFLDTNETKQLIRAHHDGDDSKTAASEVGVMFQLEALWIIATVLCSMKPNVWFKVVKTTPRFTKLNVISIKVMMSKRLPTAGVTMYYNIRLMKRTRPQQLTLIDVCPALKN